MCFRPRPCNLKDEHNWKKERGKVIKSRYGRDPVFSCNVDYCFGMAGVSPPWRSWPCSERHVVTLHTRWNRVDRAPRTGERAYDSERGDVNDKIPCCGSASTPMTSRAQAESFAVNVDHHGPSKQESFLSSITAPARPMANGAERSASRETRTRRAGKVSIEPDGVGTVRCCLIKSPLCQLTYSVLTHSLSLVVIHALLLRVLRHVHWVRRPRATNHVTAREVIQLDLRACFSGRDGLCSKLHVERGTCSTAGVLGFSGTDGITVGQMLVVNADAMNLLFLLIGKLDMFSSLRRFRARKYPSWQIFTSLFQNKGHFPRDRLARHFQPRRILLPFVWHLGKHAAMLYTPR